jgi:hypothetical protein
MELLCVLLVPVRVNWIAIAHASRLSTRGSTYGTTGGLDGHRARSGRARRILRNARTVPAFHIRIWISQRTALNVACVGNYAETLRPSNHDIEHRMCRDLNEISLFAGEFVGHDGQDPELHDGHL